MRALQRCVGCEAGFSVENFTCAPPVEATGVGRSAAWNAG